MSESSAASTPDPFPRTRRWLGIGCVAALIVTLIIAWFAFDLSGSRGRREFKERAIAQIERRWNDKAWLEAETPRLRTKAWPGEGAWYSDELILLKNGEWIICQSVCPKEQNTTARKDLFIGRGSDGKWYYSSFHFCVGKCVLAMESWQPASLNEFVVGYWLEPFDGKSDDCFKPTWTDGAYGPARLQSQEAGTR